MQLIKTALGVAVVTGDQPLLLRHIIGIGRNYADHATEQGADVPDRPMYFTKNPMAAVLHNDDIVVPRCCQDESTGGDQTDFEAELAVILKHHVHDADPDTALDHVLGYCCANDVSARWWQNIGAGGQFNRGKSFDTFCPLGPTLVPAADIPDPQNLAIRCRVNGELMQEANTSQMIFPVAELIAELSRETTLLPGTLILTGTPAGVGMARTPPRFLQHADTVEVEIEHLGVLRNTVRFA